MLHCARWQVLDARSGCERSKKYPTPSPSWHRKAKHKMMGGNPISRVIESKMERSGFVRGTLSRKGNYGAWANKAQNGAPATSKIYHQTRNIKGLGLECIQGKPSMTHLNMTNHTGEAAKINTLHAPLMECMSTLLHTCWAKWG